MGGLSNSGRVDVESMKSGGSGKMGKCDRRSKSGATTNRRDQDAKRSSKRSKGCKKEQLRGTKDAKRSS